MRVASTSGNLPGNGADAGKINEYSNTSRKRSVIAFLCALGLVVTGIFTSAADIRSVMAFNDESAASFFRNDRARSGGGGGGFAPRYYAPAPSIPSIFRDRPLRATIPEPFGRAAAPRKQKRLKAAPERSTRSEKAARRAKENSESRENRDNKDKPIGDITFSGGAQSVCVRLCDGYHFPIGNSPSSGGIAAHEAVCSATCPDAPTRLYVIPGGTDDISRAYSAREGRSYSSLPVALRHTIKHDNTCSCRRDNTSQASLVSVYRDFTLRSGDAIMTKEGFKVFKGASWPFKPKDFASLSSSAIGAQGRRQLRSIERASMRQNAGLRENPGLSPRTTSTPVPALGPFPVKRETGQAAQAGPSGRTAQVPTPMQVQ